ncbi:MAG: endonuclease III [Deferrisomatales bacterium]|nr:endonuclease III [Deferrisomatales bacterium]
MAGSNPEATRLLQILDRLRQVDPAPRPGLAYDDPWQLLVATALSAQCTDARVNQVTPGLFARYPGPRELAAAAVADVEHEIRSIGLFRNKARNLVAMAAAVAGHHGGVVPADRAALEALAGVGRKTASVVLGQGFGVPAFAVDTHVGRVCARLGFAPRAEPRMVERSITALLAPSHWAEAHLLFIHHGRRTCAARKPDCLHCPLGALCPSAGKV